MTKPTAGPRLAAAAGLFMVLAAACSRSNNLLLGRVEADLGSHLVVVTDCYRFRVPAPRIEDGAGGVPGYRFQPCRDADVLIRGADLFVNARPYGPLRLHDSVLVDHGVVSIHHRPSSPSDPASGTE
jgi:hypothetical protein